MRLPPHLLLSATDLTRFMGCQHATVLDRKRYGVALCGEA